MTEFKVGDRVVADHEGEWCDLLEGVVVSVVALAPVGTAVHGEVEVEVEFSGYGGDEGHSGSLDNITTTNRWYFWTSEDRPKLRVLPQPQHVTEVPAEKPSQKYQGNGKHTHEMVGLTNDTHVDRLRVPGGWLYRTVTDVAYFSDYNNGTSVNIVFVPMPEVVKHKV